MKKICYCLLALSFNISFGNVFSQNITEITGYVASDTIPIAGARVRIKGLGGKKDYTLTDHNGFFSISTTQDSGATLKMIAAKKGWYNGEAFIAVGDTGVAIKLDQLPTSDNSEYVFASPTNCRTCHSRLYKEWSGSAHAGATTNPLLLQIYEGTDVNGLPGIAPGFKLDFPDLNGDCADCHAPQAAIKQPGATDLLQVVAANVNANGVACDFCHKIDSVMVNYNTGVNGSIFVKRPNLDNQKDINIGSLDDVRTSLMGASFNPQYGQSSYCSACHQYKNINGVIVDDTYDSWLASNYAAQGIQCQDCHMQPNSDSTFVSGFAERELVVRDSSRIYNHLFQGITPRYLDKAAEVDIQAEIIDDKLNVKVMLTNKRAGHKLPTGVSFRNTILLVTATMGSDTLAQVAGDTIPFWGGQGSHATGNYSGLPGKGYALITRNGATGESPVGNWLTTEIVSDNRIPAHVTDTTDYTFQLQAQDQVAIKTRLVRRRIFQHWANVKGWDVEEYALVDTSISLTVTSIANDPPETPGNFILEQNYPNPFNPVTAIRYKLKNAGMTKLTIYNARGNEIAQLQNGKLSAGWHTIKWNARDVNGVQVASGVYFYRLETSGATSMTRKMILLR